MLDQITNLDPDTDLALPTASLDLSARMRDLRARQGLKQSEVARRMRLDPSIPSLWEQGKRLVPANRVRALADALEVSVEELLEGVSGVRRPTPRPSLSESRSTSMADLVEERGGRHVASDGGPLLRLVSQTLIEEPAAPPEPEVSVAEMWVIPERPPLEGWIPEGWEPGDRIQDISPALPDGYWLDPVKLERPGARQLLTGRLCAEDQAFIGERQVPGAALAERIYRHCCHEEDFLNTTRLPLTEAIFRCVVAADHGGLSDDALIETLGERPGGMPVSEALLGRLRESVRPYPIRRVDPVLFGGRR